MFRKGITLVVILLFVGMSIASTTGNINKLSSVCISNNPPYIPSNPIPSTGSTNLSICPPVLNWTGGDPDGDNVTYDVYFGNTTPPPLILVNWTLTYYVHGDLLEFNTTYYWQIVAWDEHGASTEGPIWTFTTQENLPPYAPSMPFPPDNSTYIPPINVTICWNGGDPNPCDTVTYDVYFGRTDPPTKKKSNQTQTSYMPDPPLEEYEDYYWKIVAWDSGGLSTPGPLWHFNTGSPPCPPPPTIDGPTRGKVGIKYEYTFSVKDNGCNNVSIYIVWGDGETNRTKFIEPGIEIKLNHTWYYKGNYIIMAKAKDIYGLESKWGSLEVTMPKNQQVSNMWFLRWLERFPILQKILDVLRLNN